MGTKEGGSKVAKGFAVSGLAATAAKQSQQERWRNKVIDHC